MAKKKAPVETPEKKDEFSKILLRSDRQDWITPPDLFEALKDAFAVELDPCTTADNPLGTKYFITPDQNGLTADWLFNAYVNPPYRQVKHWIRKAQLEAVRNKTTIVFLMANRTETQAAQIYGFPFAKAVCFVKGRISFIHAGKQEQKQSPTFGSMLLIFKPAPLTAEQLKVLRSIGYVFEQPNV